MADSSHVSQLTRSNSIRPRYKIIAYIVAWLVALFATNPSGGLWALAWMFLWALLLSLTHAGLTVAAGESLGLASEFMLFMPTLLPLSKPALDALSARRDNRPPHLQYLRGRAMIHTH
jgi:hypothetical protein